MNPTMATRHSTRAGSRRGATTWARLAVLACLATLTSCAEVAPWQRGTLASDRMQLDVDADETSLVTSRRQTREEGTVSTSSGGSASSAGGGCGCH